MLADEFLRRDNLVKSGSDSVGPPTVSGDGSYDGQAVALKRLFKKRVGKLVGELITL